MDKIEMTKRRLTKEEAIRLIKHNVDFDNLATMHIKAILKGVIPFTWKSYCKIYKLNPNILPDEHETRCKKDGRIKMDKENTDIKVECGSHNRIIIDKLFGPACVPNLIITWEGDDWNVRKVNSRLRKELKKAKTQTRNEIIKLIEDWVNSKDLNYKFYKEEIKIKLKEIKELGNETN